MHWFNHMKWSLYLLNKNKSNYKCQRRHFNPASQNDFWGTTAEIPYSWSYLGSTSDWLRQIYSLAARKVRSTTLIDLGNDTLSVRTKFLALVPQKVLIIALFFPYLSTAWFQHMPHEKRWGQSGIFGKRDRGLTLAKLSKLLSWQPELHSHPGCSW